MIFADTIASKNGLKIPIFSDGKPMHSKYDPEREAKNSISTITERDFFLILGIGGAYHIKELTKKFPDAMILAVEKSKEDLNYLLKEIPCVKEVLSLKNIKTAFPESLETELSKYFLPAVYSSFEVIKNTPWCVFNANILPLITESINNSLKIISQDFSTQSHFGKQWTKNIMQNLKDCKNDKKIIIPTEKTAAIIAAGPSLEKNISKLKEEREKFYIIATDTAFKILLRHEVSPDAVFSVDGQFVSINHFLQKTEYAPLFIFELTANHNAVKKISEKENNVLFTVSAHPLEQLAKSRSPESFFQNDSSSGTVTIAAIDFALKTGFSKILVFGADFAYSNGKTYASGTYLDDLYSIDQKKIRTQETVFSALMYRAELKSISEAKYTTTILDSYRAAFENWLNANNAVCKKENDIYTVIAKKNLKSGEIQTKKFDFNAFSEFLKSEIQKILENDVKDQLSNPVVVSMLPLIAYLKKQKQDRKSFEEYLKLALNFIVRYTN